MKYCHARVIVLAAGVLLSITGVRAEDPASCPAGNCPIAKGAESILARVPYLSRLFRSAPSECTDCCSECPKAAAPAVAVGPRVMRFVGPDGLERIGIDFDCRPPEGPHPLAIDFGFPIHQCAANECALNECTRNKCAADQCQGKCSAAHGCPADQCPALAAKHGERCLPFAVAGPPGLPGLPPPHLVAGPMGPGFPQPWSLPLPPPEGLVDVFEGMRQEFAECERELLMRLADARVEAATANAKLESQQELVSKQAAFAKELVAAQLENAKLAAKLELLAEKEKLASELRQAQTELTVLKAQLEVASLKARLADYKSEEATAGRATSGTAR